MRLTLASIAPRAGSGPTQELLESYLKRLGPYAATEAPVFRSRESFWATISRQAGRTQPWLVLLDSRGKSLSSEQLAEALERERTAGRQHAVFALGPADGWSEGDRARAGLLLSFGRITLPHELARVVLAEQLYRAHSILAGHPYHSGH
jgi:23S rRNA (pseudouridine1915-N3)-methyltransferase